MTNRTPGRFFEALSPFLLTLFACGRAIGPSGLEPTPGPTGPEQPPVTQTQGLVAHEWGTYTSVQSSEGKTLEGLHHIEESLPEFVHTRHPDGQAGGSPKGIESLPEPVTQKLETPVIYFYGSEKEKISVSVDFPKGVISEWYPSAAEMRPEVGTMPQIAGGSMRWEVELIPSGRIHAPVAAEDSVWMPSRRVAAAGLRAGAEEERFIFYRGLGKFEAPFFVSTGSDGQLVVHNTSSDEIPAVFLLQRTATAGAVVSLGAIGPKGEHTTSVTAPGLDVAAYEKAAKEALSSALVASGLFADEAQAMVDTWTRSYFHTVGVRVLYVAPRTWTDELLPIRITPAPTSLVRTLVGRVEVLTPAEEQAVVSMISRTYREGTPLLPMIEALGRFAEPKLRRAASLIEDPALRGYAEYLAQTAAGMP